MRDLIVLSINENSQIAEARRLVSGLARGLGFNEVEIGKVSIIVAELGTNLVKHAKGGGHLIIRSLQWDHLNGFEILSLDKGPGIGNISKALQDGYSTSGSLGTGLGAIRRLSPLFDIHSLPGLGTAVMVRVWSGPLPRNFSSRNLEIGAINLPKPSEEVCGDTWAMEQTQDRSLVFIADGLGHGIDAAQSAHEAVNIFLKNRLLRPSEIMELIHNGLKHTRGAAVAIAEISVNHDVVRFAGVGNISGAIVTPSGMRHLVSHNGTVGGEVRKIEEFTYPWSGRNQQELPILVMHSDGLATRWDLNSYAGLCRRHPSLIAGVLYRDYCRGNDDVTIVVAKPRGG
jgi:anti-sigma regulatory factor (Ser/Thr protein kinase)